MTLQMDIDLTFQFWLWLDTEETPGYDLLSADDDYSLTPFVRIEQYDLGEEVDVNVFGFAFQPNMNIIYKFDLQNITSETGAQDSDNIEFTIGWSF